MTKVWTLVAARRWCLAAGLLATSGMACQSGTPTTVSVLADGTGTSTPGLCVGPKVADAAWLAKPGPEIAAPIATVPAIGAPAPVFALTDFQPQSCGYRATYGIQAFAGRVTLVALLAGW